uniref:Uncharacterized protein n=1 Tax=Romanomermis culicivorax TaxID=13658 RepID=A0A915JFK8_ROMCU
MVNDIFLEKVKAIPTELYMNSSIVDALQQVAHSRSNFVQIVSKELFTNEERHRATFSGNNVVMSIGGRRSRPHCMYYYLYILFIFVV